MSGLLLKLFDRGADTLLNTGGDTLTERTNAKGVYTCTVTEALAGNYRAVAYLSDGVTPIAVGRVDLVDSVGTYYVVDEDATPHTDVTFISGDATAADNAESFFDGTGYAGTNNVIPTVTTLTNLPAITANWLTAAGTAADFGTEVGTAVWATTTRELTGAANITSTGGTTVPQTGDSFARIGAAGVGLTAVVLGGTQTFNNTGTWTGNIVGTLSTLTTYTGNTPQTGDSFARIGALGAGLTALAPSATAISTGTWTTARASYLDNLNVGGPVASQSDVLAINQSASKHLLIQTVGQYERPETGTTTYTVEVRTFSADTGAAVNADSTPTVAPVGSISGDLSANLGAGSNPATGVYRYVYTVAAAATSEQIRFDASATIATDTFTLSAYTQVVDLVSVTWTSTNATQLTAIFNKLPTNNIADQTLVMAAIGSPMQAGTVVLTDGSLTTAKLGTFVLAKTTNITGFNDIAATAIVSSGAITTSGGKVSGVILVDTLTTYTGNTVQSGDAFARIGVNGAGLSAVPWNATWDAEVQSEVDDAILARFTSFDFLTAGTRLLTTIELDGAVYRFTVNALELAPTGGGGGLSLVELQGELDTRELNLSGNREFSGIFWGGVLK